MASSSSNHGESSYEYPYPYPYPSHVFIPSFVTVKLSGREMYIVWETQILCLLESHNMLGFIYGTPGSSVMGKEKESDHMLWGRSDALVKGWILGSLSEQPLKYVVNLLRKNNTYFTAKDVWDKLKTTYGPPLPLPLPLDHQQAEDVLEEWVIEEESITQENSISPDTNSNVEQKTEEEKKNEAKAKAEAKAKVAEAKAKAKAKANLHQSLYEATLSRRLGTITDILEEKYVTVALTDKITINGNTALHVAIGTTNNRKFLENMLNLVPENTLLDMKNADGSTLLHVAAIVGNSTAAELLVKKYHNLLFIKDKNGDTPLHKALSNMHTGTYLYLFKATNTRDEEMAATLFAGTSGDELLVNAVSSKNYHSALDLCNKYPKPHSDAVLMAIAQNFPPEPTTWERKFHNFVGYLDATFILIIVVVTFFLSAIIGTIVIMAIRLKGFLALLRVAIYAIVVGAFIASCLLYHGLIWIVKLLNEIVMMVLHFKSVEDKCQRHLQARKLLDSICRLIKRTVDSSSYQKYYNNAMLEATRQNASEVVVKIVSVFPNAIWSVNEHGHNIIQHAVIHRSEKVYNLLYHMTEHKNVYKTIKDPFENNLLHLAGKLAPPEKLNLISGAALQIQHELQWFKEVEGFVCPLNIIQKNSNGETPQMVFTQEHKELVIEGEKWMKAAAESYSITAALITTIVFAAAITVPGGNNQDTGIPMFTNVTGFTIFAVSNAISLFTAVTSLLMFLSILTARFAEQDFLFKLPRKMIIGLVALFISTTTMIIAFGATLFLVFGQKKSWIVYPITALMLLPITFFVTLQFQLIADLVSSTYGRTIFGKKSDEPFY